MRENVCASYGESISVSLVRTSRRFDIPPVDVKLSSIATGGSLTQLIVIVVIPGFRASDPRPKASKARNVNVAIPQKLDVG